MNATRLDEVSTIRRGYRKLLELGRGGMSRVFLAESLGVGIRKLVVLKVLNPELCANVEMRVSFRREAELAAQMNHPNVVQVMEVVESAGTPVIVMEYLDGTTLSALLKQTGRMLPLPLHLHVLSQALSGLHHFHELKDLDGTRLNAVHRDMSPQNVMVLYDGPVKVLDFGIAKVTSTDNQATRTGTIKGKIHYMPPEQLFGEAGIDRRADVFAVGVMLWEAVARRRMWDGISEPDVLRRLATGALPELREVAPDAPEALQQIVRRALSIQREERFSTAQDMQVALERVMAHSGWSVQPRALGDFMQQSFASTRQSKELKIKNALRAPTGPDMLVECDQPGQERNGRPSAESLAAPIRDSHISRILRTGNRSWVPFLSLLAFAGLFGVWALSRQRASAAAASERSVPSTVTLEVEAQPAGAELFLDGKAVGKDRYSGAQPISARKVLLEVRAPGYTSERKELVLRKDLALQIVLKPIVALSPAPESSADAGESASEEARSKSSRKGKPGATAGPAAKGKCNPPYTFSADGVKTYKPECF